MFSCFFQSGRQGTPQQALGQAHEPGPLLRVGGLQDLGEVCSSICAVSRGGGAEKRSPPPLNQALTYCSFGLLLGDFCQGVISPKIAPRVVYSVRARHLSIHQSTDREGRRLASPAQGPPGSSAASPSCPLTCFSAVSPFSVSSSSSSSSWRSASSSPFGT